MPTPLHSLRVVRDDLRVVLASSAALLAAGALFAAPAEAVPGSLVTNTSSGPSITTIAGNGRRGASGNGGPAVEAELSTPAGVAEDVAGDLYIADTRNNEVREVVQPTTIDVDTISLLAGSGRAGFSGDGGPAANAHLDAPTGVAVDPQGDLFIADTGNNRIREVTPSGIITTVAGDGSCSFRGSIGNGGPATRASLCAPTGIAVNGKGDLFITDTGHDMVREVSPAGIITGYAGDGHFGRSGNGGPATRAELSSPTGLAVDDIGDLYIADTGNNQIREVSTKGVITLFAGSGQSSGGRNASLFGYDQRVTETYSSSWAGGSGWRGHGRPGSKGNGGPAVRAELSFPTGVGVDPSGNVFITDTGDNQIREVSGGISSVYAGTGRPGFRGDGGPAASAELDAPIGSIVADGGNVFFADSLNNRIRGIFVGPPPTLPQAGEIVLLPISAAVIGGAGYLVLRRRNRRSSSRAAG